MRRDKRFQELGLDEAALSDRERVIRLLLEHPALMQRPLAIRGDRALVARPSEKLLDLL